jgi:hypothetical protein
MYKKYLFPLFTAVIFLLLYHQVLTTYFTQDDFFHFKVAQTDGSIRGLLYLVGFHPFAERGIAFYRPIFRDLLYHFSYSIFSLNQYPLRILSFIIHFINGYLIFKLINKLFKNTQYAYFTAFFYILGASNVATFYYLAGGIQVLGALMFILLTILNFENYLNTKKSKYFILTFTTFLLALASHEQSFILPPLLTILLFIKHSVSTIKSKLKILVPFFIVLTVYLILNYKVIGYSKNEVQYQAQIDAKRTINSLIWYSGWAMGLPEMLIDFAPSLTQLDPRLMRYWGNYFIFILPSFFISMAVLGYLFIYSSLKNKKAFFDKRLLFFIFWYLIGLTPVIFLPFHKSGHYLTIVLPAFWGIVGFIVTQYLKTTKNFYLARIPVVILIVSLVTLSSASAILGKNFYWAAQRGRLAEKLIKLVKSQYPTLPKGAIVFFKNDSNYPYVAEDWGGTSKQASYILNGNDALQLIYNDPSLKVFYEDLGGLPENTSKENIYSFTAPIQ